MKFESVIGQESIKNRLVRTVKDNRISHAQLFLGPPGSGKLALAIAYAQYINCKDKKGSDSCGVCPSCVKFGKLAHPDLHFIFPTAKTEKIDKPVSKDFIREWRELLADRKQYITLTDWYSAINIERKQAIINARDCNSIIQTLSYKNYEADYKVMIIWMVEKLFHSAAPKILKILEEPPDKTLFILVAEDTEPILPTILSRTQIVKVPPVDHDSLVDHFVGEGFNHQVVNDAVRVYPGDLITVRSMIRDAGEEDRNFVLFRQWMRHCYAGKTADMISFVGSLVRQTREFQKSFLTYCLRMARETYLVNGGHTELSRMNSREKELVDKFSPFIHSGNIALINEELNQAIYHIERNANASVMFLDVSLKLNAFLRM